MCLASQEEPAGPDHGDPGHGDPSPLMVAASRLEVCADQFTDLVVESVLPLPNGMHIARWMIPTKIA